MHSDDVIIVTDEVYHQSFLNKLSNYCRSYSRRILEIHKLNDSLDHQKKKKKKNKNKN